MAERLIDTLAGDWNPSEYKDRYRASVLKLIENKAAGKDVKPATHKPAKPPTDLLAALRESLDGRPRKHSSRIRKKYVVAEVKPKTGARR